MATTCTPTTVLHGPADCLEGDCDEFATEDGEPTGIAHCSHVRWEQLCAQHSEFTNDEWQYATHAEPWPCQAAARCPQNPGGEHAFRPVALNPGRFCAYCGTPEAAAR